MHDDSHVREEADTRYEAHFQVEPTLPRKDELGQKGRMRNTHEKPELALSTSTNAARRRSSKAYVSFSLRYFGGTAAG